MLNRVPQGVSKSNRYVTLRHPNSIDCQLHRKTVNRVSTDNPPEIAGLPTLGGMFVLDSEDEHDYTYTPIGDGKILFMQQFQTEGSNWQDNDDGITYQGNVVEALIESKSEPDKDGFFVADKHDLVTVTMDSGSVYSYKIVGVTGSIAIPPFTRRYILNPQHDENVGI